MSVLIHCLLLVTTTAVYCSAWRFVKNYCQRAGVRRQLPLSGHDRANLRDRLEKTLTQRLQQDATFRQQFLATWLPCQRTPLLAQRLSSGQRMSRPHVQLAALLQRWADQLPDGELLRGADVFQIATPAVTRYVQARRLGQARQRKLTLTILVSLSLSYFMLAWPPWHVCQVHQVRTLHGRLQRTVEQRTPIGYRWLGTSPGEPTMIRPVTTQNLARLESKHIQTQIDYLRLTLQLATVWTFCVVAVLRRIRSTVNSDNSEGRPFPLTSRRQPSLASS